MSSKRSVANDVRWGVGWGVAFAVAFSLFAIVLSEVMPEGGIVPLSTAIPWYFVAAVVAGTILGLLRPWVARSRVGRASVGAIVGAVVYAMGVPVAAPFLPDPLSWQLFVGLAMVGAIFGAVVAFVGE